MSCVVQVLNYPPQVSQFASYDLFANIGKVVSVYKDPVTQAVLATFDNSTTAKLAVASLNGLAWYGSTINLVLVERPIASPGAASNATRQPFGNVAQNVLPLGTKDRVQLNVNPSPPPAPNNTSPDPNQYSFGAGGALRGEQENHSSCNIYLLNLSLEMTNDELKRLCGEHGTVKHVCVLATLDNAGRRRAFVDMSHPNEAKRVVEALHAKRINGYELHASYAFVQRSDGPAGARNHVSGRHGGSGTAKYNFAARAPAQLDEGSIHFGERARHNRLFAHTTPSMPIRSPFYPAAHPLRSSPCGSVGHSLANTPLPSPALFPVASSTPGTVTPPNFSTEVQVSGLSPASCIDSSDLKKIFIDRGFTVVAAVLEIDLGTGMSRGRGKVQLEDTTEAGRAVEDFHGKNIGGSNVSCERVPARFGKVEAVPGREMRQGFLDAKTMLGAQLGAFN